MKKVSFLVALVLCTLSPFTSIANDPEDALGSINGHVVDNLTKQPVAYAAVVIKSEDGSKTITGGITTEDGNFEVKKLPDGTFIFEVQFIGYKTYSQKLVIAKGKRNLNLGTVTLEEETKELEGVELVAERTTIEQKIDRKVINVGKDLTTAGASASDIMGNIPSVSITQDGDLSLRGNENVRVLVDGKPTNISSRELLQQIQSTRNEWYH